MSDLRTRIATVIVGEGCPCTYCTGFALEKADAVIAELGLQADDQRRYCNRCGIPHPVEGKCGR